MGESKQGSRVNGSSERQYVKKEDAASPAVGNDNVFITGVINAYEERNVITFDTPGAFVTNGRTCHHDYARASMRDYDTHRSKVISLVIDGA